MRELQGVVTGLIQNSVTHYSSYQEESDKTIVDLYRGVRRNYPMLGNLSEIEGRSASMSTDIRDAMLHILPRLLRVVLGSGKVIRFEPSSPGDTDADLLTEMVRKVIVQDNRGFMELYSAISDALKLDIGWVRWSWKEGGTGEKMLYKGLTENQAMGLSTMPGTEGFEVVEGPYEEMGEMVYDLVITMEDPGMVKVEAVPKEEMFFDARARSMQTADCLAHIREVPADMIVALGYEKDEIAKYTGRAGHGLTSGGMEQHRRGHNISDPIQEDESRKLVTFADAWIRVDLDDDGISELRHFHCVGSQYKILNDHGTIVERAPVAQFRSILEAHTMHGLGHGTLLADVQMQKSLMERGFMNAQARALDSRLIVKEDAVRYEDVVEAKGLHDPIRVMDHHNVGDAVSELKTQYTGDIALQGLEYLNQKRADRSGMARAAEGKDAQALQSTTQLAVAETFSRADSMTVLVLTTLCEEGLRDLYTGIADMLKRHQGYLRWVRMSDGRFEQVGPGVFSVKRECVVNVRGWDMAREVELLSLILGLQQDLRKDGSPLVKEIHIANTVRSIIRATGRFDASTYIAPWSMEDQEAHDQQMAEEAEKQPDPIEQQVVDAEKAKMLLENEFNMLKLEVESRLKEIEISSRWSGIMMKGWLDMILEKEKPKEKPKELATNAS